MLSEIQQRDAALQSANDALQTRTQELEQEVTERLRAQEELEDAEHDARAARRRAQRGRRTAGRGSWRVSKDALEKQTRILQSILDSMSDGVIVADDAGRVIVCQSGGARACSR